MMNMPVETHRDLTNEEKHHELRSYLIYLHGELVITLEGFSLDFRENMTKLRDETFKKLVDEDLLWDVTEGSK